jgi:hypothetical protein
MRYLKLVILSIATVILVYIALWISMALSLFAIMVLPIIVWWIRRKNKRFIYNTSWHKGKYKTKKSFNVVDAEYTIIKTKDVE